MLQLLGLVELTTAEGLNSAGGFIILTLAVAFFARGGTNRPRAIAEAARAIYDGFVTMVRRPFMAPPLGAN